MPLEGLYRTKLSWDIGTWISISQLGKLIDELFLITFRFLEVTGEIDTALEAPVAVSQPRLLLVSPGTSNFVLPASEVQPHLSYFNCGRPFGPLLRSGGSTIIFTASAIDSSNLLCKQFRSFTSGQKNNWVCDAVSPLTCRNRLWTGWCFRVSLCLLWLGDLVP